MKARIVYHDGTSEQVTNVTAVTELDDRFEFNVTGHIRPFHYPKNGGGVAFIQVVWHAD